MQFIAIFISAQPIATAIIANKYFHLQHWPRYNNAIIKLDYNSLISLITINQKIFQLEKKYLMLCNQIITEALKGQR